MVFDKQALPLAITCGDPAGVGPEVIAESIRQSGSSARDYVIIGPKNWTEPLASECGVQFVNVGQADFEIPPGQPSTAGATLALEAMQLAAIGCREQRFKGVVTGPVSKFWLQQVGFRYPGQTEFFAQTWGGAPSMAFVGRELKVVLATWHIPLREVASALDAACLEQAVRRAAELARAYGIEQPRIGVCGLNPHAGEGGILGEEERDLLDPCLDQLRLEFPELSRCLPGDTVFFRQRRGEFDVVIAAYHDQGLAAVKTLEFDAAVNVTLGLPHVRTSPDHGTAFELAGKGKADAGSFLAALQVADLLSEK